MLGLQQALHKLQRALHKVNGAGYPNGVYSDEFMKTQKLMLVK